MKLLQLIASVDPRHGGPVESLKRVSEELVALGHSTEVLTLDHPDAEYLENFPFPIHPLGPGFSVYQFAPQASRWLDLNATRFDAMLVRGLWRHTTHLAHAASSKSKVPYFVFAHGMLDPWFKRAYPLKHLQKYALWLACEYRVLRDANAVLFTSKEELRLASQSFSPYRCIERVVQYGTASPQEDLPECSKEFLDAFSELKQKRLVLFLGRVHPKKGCDLLIHSFAEVSQRDPNLHLVVAGPYQANVKEALDNQAERLGVGSRISWVDSLEGRLKWGALKSAEVFCLPSHQENFGIAVVEALSCGTPVLISDKVNIWEEIDSAGAGFVDSDSQDGTTSLLNRWLDLEEKEHQTMGDHARSLFAEKFEIKAAARSFITSIEELL